MIARSPVAKGLSLMLSSTLLIGSVYVAAPDLRIDIAGGGEAVEARMGTSFQDMAVGTLTARSTESETPRPVSAPALVPRPRDTAPPDRTAQPTPPAPATPTQRSAPDATPATNPAPTPARDATRSAALSPAVSAPAPSSPAVPPDAAPVIAAAPVTTPTTPSPPKAPVTLPPLIPTAPFTTAEPLASTAPVTATPPEALAAQDPDDVVPTRSVRPQARDPELAAEVLAARPEPVAAPADPAPAKRGNATRNNTQGATTGTSNTATARTQGNTGARSTQSGNAAASNYPGKVMGRIARVSKPRVRTRGTSVVAFTVAASGGLAGVSIARSSGSATLDQAAVGVIRKAAPFPRPPAGAQRSFSIRIEGR